MGYIFSVGTYMGYIFSEGRYVYGIYFQVGRLLWPVFYLYLRKSFNFALFPHLGRL